MGFSPEVRFEMRKVKVMVSSPSAQTEIMTSGKGRAFVIQCGLVYFPYITLRERKLSAAHHMSTSLLSASLGAGGRDVLK